MNGSAPPSPLAELSSGYGKDLLAHSRIRHYPKRTRLFARGDRPTHFGLITQGWVKLYTETLDGHEAVIELLTRGGLTGHETLLGGDAIAYHAEVVSDEATLLEIPTAAGGAALERNPAFVQQFLPLFLGHIRKLRFHIELLNTMNARQRAMHFLLSLHEEDGKPVRLPCEKTLIATYLGMKRETFSRILGDLRDVGVTLTGNTVTIHRAEVLREEVGFSPETGADRLFVA